MGFFCLEAIEALGFGQCEFCVTGFTVLGVIVFFPLVGVGAPFLPALSKGCLRKNTFLDEERWLILFMSNMTLSGAKVDKGGCFETFSPLWEQTQTHHQSGQDSNQT